MPHVASDLKSQLLNRVLPQAAKPAFASASPAATPFDSILDETARPAPEPRRPKPADRPSRAARSDDSAKPADAKTDPKADAASNADTGKTADDKTSDSTTTDPAKTGDDVKAAADAVQQPGEAKPADAAAIAAIAVVIDPAIAAASTQADANSATPAEVKTNTSAIAATAAATAATATDPTAQADAAPAGAELAKAAPDALAALAAKTDKAETKTDKKAATDKPATATKAADGNAATPLHQEATVPISGVAFEITNKALAGKGQFDIRLDPPDLGRIHVRLDVDRDGNVITHMVADRTDTLDMLRKDTAGLERALQDAGLKTSDNSLQFSLRDQSANQQQSNNGGNANTAHIVVDDEQLAANEPAQRNYARYNAPAGGLDIRV